jgi:flagellar assembly protein FliH
MSSVLKGGVVAGLPRAEWKVWSSQKAAAPAPPAAAPIDTAALERQAYERGLREGEAAGSRKSLEQLQAAIQGYAQSAAQLASYRTQLRGEVEKQLVELSLAVAQKILRRELSIDPNIVLAVVEGCLRELENVEIYRIRAHPGDVAALAQHFQQQRRGKVEIVPDTQVARGGALFETAQGQLDARLETQLAEITHGLADR